MKNMYKVFGVVLCFGAICLLRYFLAIYWEQIPSHQDVTSVDKIMILINAIFIFVVGLFFIIQPKCCFNWKA